MSLTGVLGAIFETEEEEERMSKDNHKQLIFWRT